MYDVIPNTKVAYCHATLPSNGMIMLGDQVFHRGNSVFWFSDFDVFDSLKDAMNALPENEEMFVLEFNEVNGSCENLWFKEISLNKGVTNRLKIWRECYGGYGHSIYRG